MDNRVNSTEATRIVYYLNDQDTPYLTKLNIPSNEITLADLKNNLEINAKSGFKFFFKTEDDEVGIVKEEIIEDSAKLPLFKGRVVVWLVPSDGTNLSDRSNSQSNGPSNSNFANQNNKYLNRHCRNSSCDTSDCDTTETESVISNKRDRRFNGHNQNSKNRHFNRHCCGESVGLTSDIDSTTFVDTDDESNYHSNDYYDNDLDDCDNLSTTSEETSISKVAQNRLKKKQRLIHMANKMQARASSVASITDSSVSMDVITVTLNLSKGSFLGISIYGQCYSNGDNGIYVGSIMDRGVVQQDGRIDVGDMILQVNDVNFENLSNDEAVAVLRKAVSKLGQIKLVVAKHCWLRSLNAFGKPDETSEETLNLKDQPVRPIDPRAWVEHTKQVNRSSKDSNIPEIDINNIQLTTKMEMLSIARAMSTPDSGLEIKDRTWLKITFPNAFLGSDVVNWLHNYVQGFNSRKEAKKYAVNMLKNGYIKHTLNKSSFSEQCYYTFSDLVVFISPMENLNLNDENNDKNNAEINYSNGSQNNPDNQNNPSQFLPFAQNTVSYGVFEASPSLQDNLSNHASNYQGNSIASSCSDQQSQTSGPIHISNFQQMKGQQQQHLFFSNSQHQQQQAQALLHHPPFAPQPSSSNQASSFFNQFEQTNHIRASSSNSSETQSSLNTLSTRDTAIGVSNGLMSASNNNNSLVSNNLTSNMSNNGHQLSNNGHQMSNLLANNNNGNYSNTHNNSLANHNLINHNLSNGLNNYILNQDNNHLNSLTNNGFNLPNLSKVHLNNHLIGEFNENSNEINDDDEQLIIAR